MDQRAGKIGVRELFKFKRRVSSVVRNLQLQSRGLAGLSGGDRLWIIID